MGRSLPNGTPRTHAENVRTDSHEVRTDSQPVRNGAKSITLWALNETRKKLDLSIEAMAASAGCPVSSMSDALAGKPGRNFAEHWRLAQGPDFIQTYNQFVDDRMGLTPGSKRLAKAKAIGELVQRLFEEAV